LILLLYLTNYTERAKVCIVSIAYLGLDVKPPPNKWYNRDQDRIKEGSDAGYC